LWSYDAQGNDRTPKAAMSKADRKRSMPVSEQAAEWLVAFDDGEMDVAEKQQFLLWLKQSPAHIKEFLQLSAMHVELSQNDEIQKSIADLVVAATSEVVEISPPTSPRSPSHDEATLTLTRRSSLRWLGIAATVVLAVSTATWVWVGQGGLESGQLYRTELGEQRSIALDDGSMITLNTLSELRVTFTEQSREVALLSGEALFDVAKDAARPFTVDAGSMQLTVVGTRFNVYRQREQTVLTVVEGKVEVAAVPMIPISAAEQPGTATLTAIAGDQVAVDKSGSGVTRATLPTAEATTAWTERKLIFQNRPLADVAEEFNRYNHRPLIVDDAELATRPITGVFNAHDAELLGTFLDNQPGIEVHRDDGAMHVRKSTERRRPEQQ